MTEEREVWVENSRYRVVLSDERATLLAAKAAGRVVVGLLHRAGEDQAGNSVWAPGEDLSCARYLTEAVQADPVFLERVVRREKGLPWVIAESKRLVIREFVPGDASRVMREAEDTEADAVFCTPELLKSYIRDQYGFYECGMWAVIRKEDGALLGKAGIVPGGNGGATEKAGIVPGENEGATEKAGIVPGGNESVPGETILELGYHIFAPYRRQGYGKEACRLILGYVGKEYLTDDAGVIVVQARTEPGNTASIRLLRTLGFEQSIPEASVEEGNPGCSSVLWFQKRIT